MAYIKVPEGHQVGMRVPRGGSSCATCEYLSEDRKHCGQRLFQKWNGSSALPAPANSYCCDFYQHNRAAVERA